MDKIIYPYDLASALQSNLILSGSRLLLRGGNYLVGDLACTLNNVTIMPYPGETVTIIPASGYRGMLFENVSNVTLSGLIIDGSNVGNECIKITGNSSNIHITSCTIRNAPTQGVLITGTVNGCEIDNCNIHHNGIDHFDHGIYISSQFAGLVATIHNNQISNNASNGIHAFSGAAGSQYIAYSNYLADNGEVGIGCYHGMATIYNNILRGNPRAIALRYDILNALVAFNTIVSSAQADIEIADLYQTPTIEIRDNIGAITNTAGATITDTNNATPALTDNGGANVVATVPVDGVAVDDITTDYGGNARGNPPTIGAHE